MAKSIHRKISRNRAPTLLSVGADLNGEFAKEWAITLLREGYSAKYVSSVMCLPEGTVRAWLAHLTRGTYEGVANGEHE